MLNPDAQKDFLKQAGYHPSHIPLEELGKTFAAYARSEAVELPLKLAQRLDKLQKHAEHLGAVRLTGECAAVLLPKSFYTIHIRVRDNPNETWLRQCLLPERDAVWEFLRFAFRAGK